MCSIFCGKGLLEDSQHQHALQWQRGKLKLWMLCGKGLLGLSTQPTKEGRYESWRRQCHSNWLFCLLFYFLATSTVVVSTDLSRKEPKRRAGVCRVVTSEIIDDVMVSTLTLNTRDVGSIPALDVIFPIFITPMTLVSVTMILYKLRTVWLLNVYVSALLICV